MEISTKKQLIEFLNSDKLYANNCEDLKHNLSILNWLSEQYKIPKYKFIFFKSTPIKLNLDKFTSEELNYLATMMNACGLVSNIYYRELWNMHNIIRDEAIDNIREKLITYAHKYNNIINNCKIIRQLLIEAIDYITTHQIVHYKN